MIDADVPGAPDWWLLRLGKKLDARCERFDLLERYYTGDHPLPEGDRRCRELFRRLQKQARTNYCQLIVDAPRERLKVVGFRTGGEGSDDADRDAWKVWQANRMDANAGLVHTAALKFGVSYVIVGPGAGDGEPPVITVEDPREVVHESDPLDWRMVRAALKTWHDEVEQRFYAVVYLPDAIYYYRSSRQFATPAADKAKWTPAWWEPDPDTNDGVPAPNDIAAVPVVPFVNRPDLKGNGCGEFEGVMDIQDRINTEVLDRMVISKMQAYRQRWAKGVKMTDEDGNPEEPFVPGADLLWAVEDENAAFGDFNQADIQPLLAAVRDDVQDMASISKTPPHYLLSGIINASGDTLKAAETGLVSKTEDMQVELGESWETVNRLAGLYADRDVPADAEVIWKDAESRTLAEISSAATQQQAVGVPWRQLMRLLGYSPPEIDRMEAERAADALIASLNAPLSPVPPGAQSVAPSAQGIAAEGALESPPVPTPGG